MARKFMFKGKSIEELRTLTIEEFMVLIDSRKRRALRRAGPKIKMLLEKIAHAKKMIAAGKDKTVKTQTREAVILPDWVGMKFGIHNGKEFKPILIREEMVGRRLGEFAHTTGRVLHSGPGVGATRGSKFIPLK
ncbi:MAG: 30S ribosomal protein S19 [Candidatus Burarchaeum sp.]|nr:30S ribosomal protein S19 [Candidatus Burarchaeum sp.]MDO8339362.1 30S ribosomal protein S19 [Candidatus Burarchaeum sp.]